MIKHPIIELKEKLLSGLNLLSEVLKIPDGLPQLVSRLNENTSKDKIKELRDGKIEDFYRSSKTDSQERKDISIMLRLPIQKYLSNRPQGDDISESETRLKNLYFKRKKIIDKQNINLGPGSHPINRYSSTPKIYLDLDGVICDFKSSVRALGDIPALGLDDKAMEEQKDVMYKAIDKAGESFWSEMSWTEDGQELWESLKEYHPTLLSSPGQFRDAPAGKQAWVNQNIPGTPLIVDSDKWQYAERRAILIDDTQNNVGAWEEADGVGILHTDAVSTIQKLNNLIKDKPILTLSSHIKRVASFLIFAAELTPVEVNSILANLYRLASNDLNFKPESLIISKQGIDNIIKNPGMIKILQLLNITQPDIKSEPISIQNILSTFMRAMQIVTKNENIKNLYHQLLQRNPQNIKTLADMRNFLKYSLNSVRTTEVLATI
jgi:hypothetical protein